MINFIMLSYTSDSIYISESIQTHDSFGDKQWDIVKQVLFGECSLYKLNVVYGADNGKV